MTTTNNAFVTVLRAVGAKGFGFLSVAEGEAPVFVTESHLINSGFGVDAFKDAQSAIIDFRTEEDGRRRVVKIHSIDGVVGKVVKTDQTAPSIAKVVADKPEAPAKKWQFFTATHVDTHENKRLVKVCKFGTTAAIQYVVFTKEDDGRETSQLLPIGTNAFEARKLLGKDIIVPPCKGHGEKTKVVKPKSESAGKGEKKSKKKAA